MKYYLIPLVILGLFLPVASASDWNPEDFAHGRELNTQPGANIYRLQVQSEVYEGVADKALGDVRIFNADGSVVPFVVRSAGELAALRNEERPLEFFRLMQQNHHPDGVQLPTAYVIEIGDPEPISLEGVTLNFSVEEAVTTELRVAVSNDRNNWVPVSRGDARVNFSFRPGEENLVELSIGGMRPTPRYVHVDWQTNPGFELQLTDVTGSFLNGRVEVPSLLSYPTRSSLSSDEKSLRVELENALPVEYLGIVTDFHHPLAYISVESRAESGGEWQHRADGVFYDLRAEGSGRGLMPHQRGIRLDEPVTDRYWRLTSEPKSLLKEISNVSVGWRQHRLDFVPMGPEPYVLAWGNPSASQNEALGNLIRLIENKRLPYEQSMRIRTATRGAQVDLGGEAVFESSAETSNSTDQDRYALWVLMIIVLVVAISAASYLIWKRRNLETPDSEQ